MTTTIYVKQVDPDGTRCQCTLCQFVRAHPGMPLPEVVHRVNVICRLNGEDCWYIYDPAGGDRWVAGPSEGDNPTQ